MKLGSAPLHNWVPDVYEGAEFLFTAFLILVISPALNFKFFVFIKLLLPIFEIYHLIFMFFLVCGFLSIILGVTNAVVQTRLKRFLAYASINHLGFILLSLGTPSYIGFFASLFYLFTYILTNLTFFGLILIIQQFNFVTFIYLNQLKSLLNYNYLIEKLKLLRMEQKVFYNIYLNILIEWKSEDFEIFASHNVREITAIYTKEGQKLEIVI